ncbi:MAG: hypothetical protein JWQ89_4261, partial [Devosia sp.]|uniref:BON domain-containing protein n=1 Tax=Devosia sp. TaxID=1871048 RepID=UPI002617B770
MEDQSLRDQVEAALAGIPELRGLNIAVAESGGVITFTGFVESFTQRWLAEDMAKRIPGVASIANDLEVRLPAIDERPDPSIAQDIVVVLDHEMPEIADRIKVTVENGWVTLEGQVPTQSQRERVAENAGRARGVRGITNDLVVKPTAGAAMLQR